MPDHLLSPAQLGALQKIALSGMKTPVTIQRKTMTDSAYGDAEEVSYVTVTTATGWFYSTPTPVATIDGGSVVTVNTYRLFLPVDTNVQDGDQILVDDARYVVTDTTKESTWKALLACSLRKRE
jgi:hypothetical protein